MKNNLKGRVTCKRRKGDLLGKPRFSYEFHTTGDDAV